jgi:hypothetical protein
MTEREQHHQLARWNRELVRETSRLQEELRRAELESAELRVANANVRVERDAADVLLGEAMDRFLRGSER